MDKDKAKKIIRGTVIALGAAYVVLDVIAKKQKADSTYKNDPDQQNPMQGKSVRFVTDENDKENADGKSGHLEATGESNALTRHRSAYEKYGKRAMDKALSFGGLVVLAPVMGTIALAIKIEDPGPVLFTQKRVGQDKQYFKLHKFRSMKMSTPHDVPTHMLENPEQYITKVGGFIRRHSLDELPQIWDIFVGNMSVIGPRPALWNQDVLVAERDKVEANDVKPGLTGWAQINGRDELSITDKSMLDGVYTKSLKAGGTEALKMDLKCFAGSIHVFNGDDSVVEGGTGAMAESTKGKLREGVPEQDPEEHFACDYKFTVNHNAHKNILIVGAGSYIGESFVKYANEHYGDNFTFTTVDTLPGKDGKSELDNLTPELLASFDIVYHLAGIAHADVGHVDDATKEKYYKVNTDLAITAARRYKTALEESGKTGLFVFMSSMIVYGDSAPYGEEKIIDRHTSPSPANFYGDSKWQADKGIRSIADSTMQVAIIRPPMIYGKGSKGNYPTLSKLARKLPVFPYVENKRSMLYVGNLCEFLCQMFLATFTHKNSGEANTAKVGSKAPDSLIFIPQNEDYTKTSDMVKKIAKVSGHHILIQKVLNPAVALADHVPGKVSGLVDKAFGNNAYDEVLSQYDGFDYQKYTLVKSIELTEGSGNDPVVNSSTTSPANEGHTHLLVISQYFYPETFRINDMAQEWVKRGYRVTVLTGIPNYPMGKFFDGYDYKHHRHEIWNGIEIIRIPIIARGSSSIGMVANYISFINSGWLWNLTSNIHADYVFTFEVSPMTQALIGCWYSKKHHVPNYLYVQDLWPENVEIITGIHNKAVIGPINHMVDYIYKNTDQIFTTSQSFVNAIVNRPVHVDRRKVHYWPQYAEDFYKPIDKIGALEQLKANGLAQKTLEKLKKSSFKIAFTGNIGFAQGLDILPKTAEKLKDNHTNVIFIIVGDGRYQAEFEEDIRNREVEDYFIMVPRQQPENIKYYLGICDAAFLSFMDTELFEHTIPAKLQSYMACGKTIIASANGETKRIIEESGCGICCEIGNSSELAYGIMKLQEDKEGLSEMSVKAREYFESYFDKKMLMNQMDKWFGK